MLTLDGSEGEGGGQILRTALALSIVTGTPFEVKNIRARRKNPGLQRQHLVAVQAAARVGGAEVRGAAPGSSQLSFRPSGNFAGTYAFDIGTAGSATLVLQTILPALLRASGPSTITVEGGTHNPMAPPYDFLEKTFLPLVTRMGAKVGARLERRGFYPAGGGKAVFTVEPGPLAPLELLERGELRAVRAKAIVARLPADIAKRELAVLEKELKLDAADVIEDRDSRGPGNAALVEVESAALTEVFTAVGERGVRAEAVAGRLAEEVRRHLDSGAPVGEHLADQLLLPLALAGGGAFLASRLSDHATTNMGVVRKFLDVRFDVSGGRVAVRSRGSS